MTFRVISSKGGEHGSLVENLKVFAEPPELSEDELLRMQHAKLVNLYGDMLCEEWGGNYLKHRDHTQVMQGRDNFLKYARDQSGLWVSKSRKEAFWGPTTVSFSATPCKALGRPYELYFCAGGSVILLRAAADLFGLLTRELSELKLQLIVDEVVVDAVIRHMLRPRPKWQTARAWELETLSGVRS